ncbi:MAG: urate hydroxylase PuuD [Alphaproteobacteria bacterium]|nr:urate hydroxylase PuuD [Alphaproteobacteria bacterium]
MFAILSNLRNTIIAGIVLLLALVAINHVVGGIVWAKGDGIRFTVRWLHVLSGVMWIGLLWYFNFVQIPNMGKIEDAHKPAITKVIAPAALFWFRWAALATLATGLLLGWINGYLVDALILGTRTGAVGHVSIGIGMWLGVIMAFNVWFVIWPNQKIALGIIDSDKDKAKAGRTAMLFSRTNTMLSIPMLYAMVSAQGLYVIS